MNRNEGGSSPLRPASREIAELQQAIDRFRLSGVGFEDNELDEDEDEDEDENDELQTKMPIARPRAAPWNTLKPHKRLPRPPVVPSWQNDLPIVSSANPLRPAAAPSFTRAPSRSVSNSAIASYGSPLSTSHIHNYHPPVPNKNPLRLHFDQETSSPHRAYPNFSYRLKTQPDFQAPLPRTHTAPLQQSRGLHSYSKHAKANQNLRHWSSLETIHSVPGAQSLYEEEIQDYEDDILDYPLDYAVDETLDVTWNDTDSTSTADSRRQFLVFYDDEEEGDEGWGREAAINNQVQSNWTAESPRQQFNSHNPTPKQNCYGSTQMDNTVRRSCLGRSQTPLRTLRMLDSGVESPVRQTSRTNSTTSSMTISSGKPSETARPISSAANTSQTSASSKEWKSSEFDISGLTVSELKKCKKKGINPALYAEMKAARKGRRISPIGGNTFI